MISHRWDVSTAEAPQIQTALLQGLAIRPLDLPIANVAGVDVSTKGQYAVAVVALLSYPDLKLLGSAVAEAEVTFPYVPGLLAFREGPVALAALRRLEPKPDVLMCDAHGIAHPRRMGLATHLGVLLNTPSIGCAKSRLIGESGQLGTRRGSREELRDGGEIVGAVVRTRDGVRPVYVSVGHRVDLESSVSLVLTCATKYRLPEPTRWAHRLAGSALASSTGRLSNGP